MRDNFFFSSAQVICRALSDSNSAVIDFIFFFSLSISLPCKRRCHLMSNYMLG